FFFSSRRRHTSSRRDWSSDVCSSDLGRVGAIVESPKFFPTFTGERILSLLADAIGTPRARVGEVLDSVGLGDRGHDRFRSYSLRSEERRVGKERRAAKVTNAANMDKD